MAKSRIIFDDGGDTAALAVQSDYPVPACRFSNWVPMTRPIGHVGVALADERQFMFTRRTDYGATFQVMGLRSGAGPTSMVDLANRLIAHLMNGGTCAVYTEDALGSNYTNCGLWPDSQPSLDLMDPVTLEYQLTVQLLNLDGTRMICHYA